MRRPFASTATLLFVLACGASALALNPDLDIIQYAHTTWRVRDGFTRGAIYSIAQTPDGYLWLGTQFGLVRFDGVLAVPWQPPESQHLPKGAIYSLLVAHDGTLWIGAKGLASWKDGKLTRYSELADQFVLALREDREGTVWAASGSSPPPGRLCSIRSGNVRCYGNDGALGRAVVSIYEDTKGTLWAGVIAGLWRWKPGPPKFYSLPGDVSGIHVLGEDNGALLVGWKNQIYRFIDGKTEPYPFTGGMRQFYARSTVRDRNAGLWIATSQGLLHVHESRTDVFSSAEGLSGDDVGSIFEDREDNVWVCTIDGLDRFRDFSVATFSAKQGLSNTLVGSILADKNGSVWMGTSTGLNRTNHGRIMIPPTGGAKRDGELKRSPPSSLFEDHLGRLWVATPNEIGRLENDRYRTVAGFPAGHVLSMAEDVEGSLWVVNEDTGLIEISPQDHVREIPWSALEHKDHASVLAVDRRQGGLWIGFFRGGMSYFADGQIRKSYTAADGLGSGRVGDFLFDDDGAFWISTEGGLSRLKNNRLATLTSENGLPCDTVHWAAEEDDRSIWLYTACGLVRIARSELDSWAAIADKGENAKRTVQVTVYDSSDGVRSLSSPGHYHPQVAKTSDGKLWFLPWDGVSVIDPRHLPFNRLPPPVHIERMVADGKEYDITNRSPLAPHVRNLSIDYTALSLVVPEKVHFRVKLEGQDKDWRELVNVRHVDYTNLPPRHYRFRVLACNNSGVWNETGASLEFSIAPAYYQATWFYALCVAAFAGLLWALYLLRLHQLRRQFTMGMEERVGERLRIARDLHDTLLQSFSALLLRLQTVSNVLPASPDEARRRIDSVIEQASNAIAEGRDAVHELRSSAVATMDLDQAITSFAKELRSGLTVESAPEIHIEIQGKPRLLNPEVRDEVFRIAAEALRNTIRHAHARRIEVEIRYDEHQLELRVKDDGKGIDPAILGDGRSVAHWGLRGMRERAKLIGSTLEVWSQVAVGTEIAVKIPATRVYTKPPSARWPVLSRLGRG